MPACDPFDEDSKVTGRSLDPLASQQLEFFLLDPVDCEEPVAPDVLEAEMAPLAAPWLRLVTSRDPLDYRPTPTHEQPNLPNLFCTRDSNIVRLVPPDRYPALNRHFPSLAGRDRKLARIAVGLARIHRLRLGDVVELNEGQILEINGFDEKGLERLERLLAGFGLALGMIAPRWHSPGGLISNQW